MPIARKGLHGLTIIIIVTTFHTKGQKTLPRRTKHYREIVAAYLDPFRVNARFAAGRNGSNVLI